MLVALKERYTCELMCHNQHISNIRSVHTAAQLYDGSDFAHVIAAFVTHVGDDGPVIVALSRACEVPIYTIRGWARGIWIPGPGVRRFVVDRVLELTDNDGRHAYRAWTRGVSRDHEILGGEPVFSGTRLSVRMVGAAAAHVAHELLVTDYPYLRPVDFEFSARYVRELENE